MTHENNPYDAPTAQGDITPNQRIKRNILLAVGFVIVIFFLLLLLLPATRRTIPASRRNGCINNLKSICLALLKYEEANGELPPAYTEDENGNRLHSWRTLILPYLDEQALYDSIDLSKPWDHPVNGKQMATVIDVYCCPSLQLKPGYTSYLTVLGDDFVFNGSTSRKTAEITDGTSKTILVFDAGKNEAVPWMSPFDTDERFLLNFSADASEEVRQHSGIILAGFADGHVDSIPVQEEPESIRASLTHDSSDISMAGRR